MTSAAKLSKSFEKVIIEVLLLYMVIPRRIKDKFQPVRQVRQTRRTVLPPELRTLALEEPELASLQRQSRLRFQCIIRIVKRGQGHDEGKANGVFHVQLQVADDQYVPDETNF